MSQFSVLLCAVGCLFLHVNSASPRDHHQLQLKRHYDHLAYIAEFPCHLPQPRVVPIHHLIPQSQLHGKAYFPDVTVLHRCDDGAGCCPDSASGHRCTPIHTHPVHLPFKVTYLQDMKEHKKGSWVIEYYDMDNHTECACIEPPPTVWCLPSHEKPYPEVGHHEHHENEHEHKPEHEHHEHEHKTEYEHHKHEDKLDHEHHKHEDKIDHERHEHEHEHHEHEHKDHSKPTAEHEHSYNYFLKPGYVDEHKHVKPTPDHHHEDHDHHEHEEDHKHYLKPVPDHHHEDHDHHVKEEHEDDHKHFQKPISEDKERVKPSPKPEDNSVQTKKPDSDREESKNESKEQEGVARSFSSEKVDDKKFYVL